MVPIASAVCTVPAENFEVTEDIVMCNGVYSLESGIIVLADNLSIDCSHSVLMGNGIGYGILLKNKNKVVVQNCNISNYEIGIYLHDANNNTVKNNHISNNKFGIALFNSFNNDFNGNILSGNIASNAINYLLGPHLQKTNGQMPKEEPSPNQIMLEAIRIKKPFLGEKEAVSEANSILDRYFNATRQNLEIIRTVSYSQSDNSTKITLHLRPKKILLNASIYEKIPKCVSSYAGQILFETGGYEVILDDPLVMWTFFRLDNEKKIIYKVLKNIDEECKSLLFAFGIAAEAKELEKPEVKRENRNYLAAGIAIMLLLIAAFYFLKMKSP
jgi:parallel beta-helix repeat protein